jgi:hypothetical protein
MPKIKIQAALWFLSRKIIRKLQILSDFPDKALAFSVDIHE